ncbi:anthranilate synthase component II [Terrilactibacillus laevilacticus]|uniref:Anthranilate synthase component II n=1 Tax=Terrilactibacillus laevilacticus TaxID=1380157 RepID=A0ABW5PM58_9BACI|nr:aminodeoxychorismate/anthranilate synthase component II [Terrilactibacillus laevilacticus]
MILMIDNYDSFTYNLVHYMEILGHSVITKYNDHITTEDIINLNPDVICLSPGPGTPIDAGCCLSVVNKFKSHVPILGICLGHQVIAEAFGGQIEKAAQPMHGKTDQIFHDGQTIFQGLPNPLKVARYHSLVASHPLPKELVPTSKTATGEIMSVRHQSLPIEGIQFHPEAIQTEFGLECLKQFFQTYDIQPDKELLK